MSIRGEVWETGTVLSLNTSRLTGEKKTPAAEVELRENFGIVGDAHTGDGIARYPHRQVSLLARESIDTMVSRGADVAPGSFAENITTNGLTLTDFPTGSILEFERGPILEVTQIGKECHTRCAIFQAVGDCVMPREGIFCRVKKGGVIFVGDTITVYKRGEYDG